MTRVSTEHNRPRFVREEMRVFLSWSGQRSRELAQFLNDWLPKVIQAVEPWMSEDIEKGDRWQPVMDETLESTQFGIFCLTTENISEPWINFEAGAITKQARESRGWTVLVDLTPGEVPPPLGKFQHTTLDRENVRKLLGAINGALKSSDEKPLPEKRLDEVFDTYWGELKERTQEIVELPVSTGVAKRDPTAIMEEVLAVVRRLERKRRLILPRRNRTHRGSVHGGEPCIRNGLRHEWTRRAARSDDRWIGRSGGAGLLLQRAYAGDHWVWPRNAAGPRRQPLGDHGIAGRTPGLRPRRGSHRH